MSRSPRLTLACLALSLALGAIGPGLRGIRSAAPPSPPGVATAAELHFENKVRPLLIARCLKCHGEQAKGGLRLDSPAALKKGGDSGQAVVPGQPDKSLLIQAVRGDGELRMPPGRKLSPQEVADL